MARSPIFRKSAPTSKFPSTQAVQLLQEGRWDDLNALIVDGLNRGDLAPSDLDFKPEKQVDGSPRSPLWPAFEESIRLYTSPSDPSAGHAHRQGLWILRSWEVAAKADWLKDVLSESPGRMADVASLDSTPSTVFQKIHDSVRAFMWDIQFKKAGEISLSLRNEEDCEVAPGVVRIAYSSFEGLNWQNPPSQKFPEAMVISNFKPFEESVFLTRTNSLSHAFSVEGNANPRDRNAPSWSHGTWVIAREKTQLDAFLHAQPDAALFEQMLDAAACHTTRLQEGLHQGFDPDQRAEHRQSKFRPIHFACQAGNFEAIKALIEAGSSVNRLHNESRGAIFELVLFGQGNSLSDRSESEEVFTNSLRLLLAAGADINERESVSGNSPLALAVCGKREWVLRVLLDHGADMMQKNASNQTIFDEEKIEDTENDNPMGAKPVAHCVAFLEALRAGMEVEKVIAASRTKKMSP